MSDNLLNRYGPWALVTGASSGIGRAFAYELAERKFNLVLVTRSKDVLEAIAIEIKSKFAVEVCVITADLGNSAGSRAVLDQVESMEIGLLVASAGFGGSGPFVEGDVLHDLDMIQVNCTACVELTHSLSQKMKGRKRGGVILLSSLLGWQGVPLSAIYAATKSFIQSFAEAIHIELKPDGVDVLAVAPGPVVTNFDRRANMTIEKGATPKIVAQQALTALGRRSTVVPGPLSKLLTYSLLALPRAVRVRIMRQIMSGLSNHGK